MTPSEAGVLGSRRYLERRAWIEGYFDRTAAAAWARLTSDAPVSGVRARVRAGRDRMRSTLTTWLPDDLSGTTVLDAGCGPGTLATELAARGATVVGVDLSPTLVELARERAAALPLRGSVEFRAGDMLDPAHGRFDWIVAMDSVIHYAGPEMSAAVAGLAHRARRGVLFTFVPRTPLLATVHAVGRLFPRKDRAPAVEPQVERLLMERLAKEPGLAGWRPGRSERVNAGVYVSQAVELVAAAGGLP
jgi:magnesium-protoporphyrin O-methyltransferase